MQAGAAERLRGGALGKGMMKKISETTDLSNLFEDNPNYEKDANDEMIIRKIRENLFSQLGWRTNAVTEYGSTGRTSQIMGLKQNVDTDNNTFFAALVAPASRSLNS